MGFFGHHGLRRLAPTLPVSVACVGQVAVRPCVRPSGVAGVYCAAVRRLVLQGVLLGGVGPAGVVVVYGRARSRRLDAHWPALCWEGVTPQSSCRSLSCAWPAGDSRRARAALHRRGRSCGRAWLRVLSGVPSVAPGRRGGHGGFCAQGPGVLPGALPQCGWRAAVICPAPAPRSGGAPCSTTPPWSLARPRAPRVWLAPLPGPSRIRYAGEEGQVG